MVPCIREISSNMCIVIVFQQGCEVMGFEVNFDVNYVSNLDLFLHVTNKSRQNCKNVDNEKSSKMK